MRDRLTSIVVIAGVILLSYWSQQSPAMQGIEAFFAPHRDALLVLTIGAAILGYVIFMTMTIYLALTRGTPMTPEQIVEQSAHRFRRYKFWGKSVGRAYYVELSFKSIKEAFRTGKVLWDPYWRPLFILSVGFWLIFLGSFGTGFFGGPPLAKLLVGPAVIYALARTAWGFYKA